MDSLLSSLPSADLAHFYQNPKRNSPVTHFLFNPLGTPLYAKQSEFNHREFGYVIPKVLLPMALDYHIRSREIDVNDTAAEELSNLNGEAESKNQAIRVCFTFCLVRPPLYFLLCNHKEKCLVSLTFACRSKSHILAPFTVTLVVKIGRAHV